MDAKQEARLSVEKSAVDSFELPCGYVDQDGNLQTYIEVTEITGDEEEILAAKNMPVMKKMNNILTNCTKCIGDVRDRASIARIIPELTQGDRVFLLFAIRRVSLGNDFPFTTNCPNCSQESSLIVDLSELEIKKMADPKLRVYELELPKSKRKVTMKVLTGRGEDAISKASVAGKDVISIAILTRIEALDGKPASLMDLKKMSLADRNYLRSEWQDHEGGIDTGVEIQCPQCDHEYNSDVDIGAQGFFNPLAASKASKTKLSP